jgi:hypothetical protein
MDNMYNNIKITCLMQEIFYYIGNTLVSLKKPEQGSCYKETVRLNMNYGYLQILFNVMEQ